MGLNTGQGGNEVLFQMLVKRAGLEQDKKTLDLRMTEWKDEALPLMVATGVKSFKDENIGSMTVVDGSSVSINRDLLIQNLLAEGMDADKVATVVEKSTKVSRYQTIQFKARTGK